MSRYDTGEFKTKLAHTRGENFLHAVPPDLYSELLTRFTSLQPLTEQPVSFTCTGGRPSAPTFNSTLTSGFLRTSLEETLNLGSLLPVRDVTTYSSRSMRFYLFTSYWSLITDQVGEIGLEPTTSAMSKQCSNQLSYPPERLTL